MLTPRLGAPRRSFHLQWRIFVAAKSKDQALRRFERLELARTDGWRVRLPERYYRDPSLWEAVADEECAVRSPAGRLFFCFERAQIFGRGWFVSHVNTTTGECDLIFDARQYSKSSFAFLTWMNLHLWPPGSVDLDNPDPTL